MESAAPLRLTAIHRAVERCRANAHPALIARLDAGWAVMGDRQVFEGYCLLLPDPVVPHLNALESSERARFLADMARLGDAVLAATGAVRINYALFGNTEPALHAHVFPRRADEAPAIRAVQPWALDWQAAPEFSAALHGELRGRIVEALTRSAIRLRRSAEALSQGAQPAQVNCDRDVQR